jgi:hypothetical protein
LFFDIVVIVVVAVAAAAAAAAAVFSLFFFIVMVVFIIVCCFCKFCIYFKTYVVRTPYGDGFAQISILKHRCTMISYQTFPGAKPQMDKIFNNISKNIQYLKNTKHRTPWSENQTK